MADPRDRTSFPDLAISHEQTSGKTVSFSLETFDPDVGPDGRARNEGHTIFEQAEIVGDSNGGYDPVDLAQVLSLIEHAPAMFHVLHLVHLHFSNGGELDQKIVRILNNIRAGQLMYGSRWLG